jgi:hypothetical protein
MFCNSYRPELHSEELCREVFEKMNKTERVCSLFKEGKELLSRENHDYVISLYILKDFFVEIWYQEPGHKVDRIDITTNEEVMANYEEEIDLTDLF